MRWKAAMAGLLLPFLFGCATSTANYPLKPHVWNRTMQRGSGIVVYYRQALQTPREAFRSSGGVSAQGVLQDVAKGAIGGITDAFPKIAQTYSAIRNSNGFSNVEIYVAGCKTPEDLEAVRKLIETIGRD